MWVMAAQTGCHEAKSSAESHGDCLRFTLCSSEMSLGLF